MEAFQQLLQTNPLCGDCMLRAFAAVVTTVANPTTIDKSRALLGCLHQEENRCDQATGLSRIEPMLVLASVADRGSLVRMLELVEAGLHITPDAVLHSCSAVRCRALQLVPTACSRQSSTCTARDLSARSSE
jgi:tRNA U54 and U55 pseudouridine synthase Pus10